MLLAVLGFSSSSFATIVRVPGVHKGEWFKYAVQWSVGSNDPALSTYFPNITTTIDITNFVSNVSDSKVWLVQTLSYPKYTQNVTGWIDVTNGEVSNYNMFYGNIWFIAANLSAGDTVWVGQPYVINYTLSKSYLNRDWTVNQVSVNTTTYNQPFMGGYLVNVTLVADVFWDRPSGALLHTPIINQTFTRLNYTSHWWLDALITAAALVSHMVAGTYGGITYYVEITSTSIISDFYFDPSMRTVGFTVSGTGTGFCNLTFRNELITPPYIIFVEDSSVPQEFVTSGPFNSTHTWLYFNYTHSTLPVLITGATAVPEFTSPAPIFLLITTMASMAIILRKRRRSK